MKSQSNKTNMQTTLELLAPAGDQQCAKAAVANGADAIYFGLDSGFNARARATSISLDVLPEFMAFLHQHGVAGYVTTNILAFTDELPALETTLRRIAEAGADAVLVQDLGLVHLIRRTAPGLAIHASTQMSLTSAESINKVRELGVERVVLARELSVREIAQIHENTSMALEVFVHGALCVAYSGQCLTSESLGGRSANRGQCAQACRLPYELICDGRDVDLADQKYLLSPKDLAAYALVPQLIGHTTFNWVLRYVPAANVSVLVLGEPVGTIFLAWLVLAGEAPAALQLTGAALVLAGIWLVARGEK